MKLVYFADVRLPLERANGIQTVETCHALARRGHEVTLVARPDACRPPRDPLAYYGLPPVSGLRVVAIPFGRVSTTPASSGLARLLRHAPRIRYLLAAIGWSLGRGSADVLFTRDLGLASALLCIPRSWRPPVVYESHGFAPAVSAELDRLLSGTSAGSRRKQRRLRAREQRVWRESAGYVTITAALAERLRGEFGPRLHVAVVPDGARVTDPPPRPAPMPATPTIGYAGHLYPWKGVEVLVDALARVTGVRGLIIGGHPREGDLDRLRARVGALGLADRVELTGYVPPTAVAPLLARADVLVLPNRRTTLSAESTSPLKLFEYLALAKPIIASDLPALREVLDLEAAALFVPPDDPEALARAIRTVVDDPATATALASRAAVLARAYSWDRRAERLEAVLGAAVGRPR